MSVGILRNVTSHAPHPPDRPGGPERRRYTLDCGHADIRLDFGKPRRKLICLNCGIDGPAA